MTVIYVIYGLVNVLDAILTVYGISHGVSQEGNPLIQMFIDWFGLVAGVSLGKLFICGLVVSVSAYIYPTHKRIKYAVICGIVLTVFAVYLWLCQMGV